MNEPAAPLDYGRQPRRLRRWWPWLAAVAAVVVTAGIGWYVFGERVERWWVIRQYNAEAAAWSERAADYDPPADALRYTENVADAPGGKFATSKGRSGGPSVGFAVFGDPTIDRYPAYTNSGPILSDLTQTGGAVFVGERTNAAGVTRLFVVSRPGITLAADGTSELSLDTTQVGPSLAGDAKIVVLRGGSQKVNVTGFFNPGEVRLFAGRRHPDDAARLSIPFEVGGRRGFLDGFYDVWPSEATNPEHRRIEVEANSALEWSVRWADE